ncbi:alkyldihydroxyacetone phosphate synthase [Acrasis kona]|uniref:Alkylglycerone-phosphate synthase n=1 Tax=Acrasis kona TaxID=1008807 RepID=A0AAW2YLT9_9EUKA
MNPSQDERVSRRIQVLSHHINSGVKSSHELLSAEACAAKMHYDLPLSKRNIPKLNSVCDNDSADIGINAMREKERLLKWNGWGYKDTEFLMHDGGDVYVKGGRYPVLSGKILPHFRDYIERVLGCNSEAQSPPQTLAQMKSKIHKANLNEAFVKELQEAKSYKFFTTDDEARLLHSHGHCLQEIYQLRWGHFKRLVDAVVYPGCHEDVEKIIALCVKHNVGVIPFGGGSTVSQALMCPENEERMILSLDTQEMNKIRWIDRENNTALIEAGAVGIDIHEELAKEGLTLGHEPDSFEISTMGGWVATRASGMKKNSYGNIEDFVVKIKMVTCMGTIDTIGQGHQRKSHGIDLHQIMLGSEGTMGVITEVIVRVSKLPAVQRHGSVAFKDYATGVAALREITSRKFQPSAIRLLDNTQFKMGAALKVKSESIMAPFEEWLKHAYLTKLKGFDMDKIAACTILFEGHSAGEVSAQEKRVYDICKKHGGIVAGEEGGRQGFQLTHVIAYLRDIMMAYHYVAESFEAFVPWNKIVSCTDKVYERIRNSCKERGVEIPPWICARVSQVYDNGACVYFYFGFVYKGLKDPVKTFSEVEAEARNEILAQGGSLSHHHGVGKLRKEWMESVVSPVGLDILRKIKNQVDPQNIFCNGNMGLTPSVITFPQ